MVKRCIKCKSTNLEFTDFNPRGPTHFGIVQYTCKECGTKTDFPADASWWQ